MIFIEAYNETDRNFITGLSNLSESVLGMIYIIISGFLNHNWKYMMVLEFITFLIAGLFFLKSNEKN